MKAEIEVENPDAVSLTVSVTMTLGEWRAIHKTLVHRDRNNGDYWPVGAFALLVGRAVEKVDKRLSDRESQTP